MSGRIIGPFDTPPFENFRISPLGLVPKKAPGEFRLIHHLSFPEGSSVNDGIPRELSSVHYATIDDAIKKMSSLGAGCFLAKTDIKSAFRIIPLHPRDFDLLGLEWEGKFYFDRCLPMGCSSLCNIFETFSTALEWIATAKLQASAVIHILDDFLFLAPSRDKCHRDLDNFIKLCNEVGVPIADEKTVGPRPAYNLLGSLLTQLTCTPVCRRISSHTLPGVVNGIL